MSISETSARAYNIQKMLPDGLGEHVVAWWHMGEGEGNVVKDCVGENDGKIMGASWIEENGRNVLSFDGVNDYVEVNAFTSGNFDFSVSCWVNAKDNNTRKFWFSYNGYFEMGSDGKWRISIYHNEGSNSDGRGPLYNINQWYHTLVEYNATTKVAKLYVDNQLMITTNIGDGNLRYFGKLKMGNFNQGNFHFNGLIGETILFDNIISEKNKGIFYENQKGAYGF